MTDRHKIFRDRILRDWPSLASAVALLLAFPPFNLGLLVLVALVPWLASLRPTATRSVTGRDAWRRGYRFGFIFGLGQLVWVGQLVYHWIGNIWLGSLVCALASAIYALYFGWTAVLIRHAWVRGWPWAIPLVWAGIEVFRSFIPTFAFPYGLVANPLWPYPALIQNAHFGSIYFVSAWVILINTIGAMWFDGEGYVPTRRYITVALALAAMSLGEFHIDVRTKPLAVTVGQPGVDMAFGAPDEQERDLATNVGRIIRGAEADGSQLIVLPEGIADVPVMPPRPVFPLPKHIPVIFGGQRGTGPIYQSAYAYDGVRWQVVDKTRLVVFGEFIPGREMLGWVVRGFRLPAADLSPGIHGVQTVRLAGLTIGPVVCFESLFPDVSYKQAAAGARLLAVIGIDDWFLDGNAPAQLRAASIWRAVETGLPLVRATTQGFTMACDGHGRMISEAPLRRPIGLRVEVPIPDRSPLFRALPVFPAAACVWALIFPWLRRFRPSQDAKKPESGTKKAGEPEKANSES